MYTAKQAKRARDDRDWWYAVGRLIDPSITLVGWNYRLEATFTNPQMEVSGQIGVALLTQQATIIELRSALSRLKVG